MAACFDIHVTGLNMRDLSSQIAKEFVVYSVCSSDHLETIFGEQITDQIVCLIVNMWNALPLLSLCSFWQAAFQVKQNIEEVVVATDHL